MAVSEQQGTMGQLMQLFGMFIQRIDLEKIPRSVLQNAMYTREKQDQATREMELFLRNGCRVNLGDFVVRPVPLDPVEFFSSQGWGFLSEEHDSRNETLAEVDFAKVDFVHCLNGEEVSITGEEKLSRLKASSRIRYGASVFYGLWADYQANRENSVLERLYREKKINYLDFFGDVLRHPGGRRYVLYLRRGGAEWYWGAGRLSNGWGAADVSAVSPASPSGR